MVTRKLRTAENQWEVWLVLFRSFVSVIFVRYCCIYFTIHCSNRSGGVLNKKLEFQNINFCQMQCHNNVIWYETCCQNVGCLIYKNCIIPFEWRIELAIHFCSKVFLNCFHLSSTSENKEFLSIEHREGDSNLHTDNYFWQFVCNNSSNMVVSNDWLIWNTDHCPSGDSHVAISLIFQAGLKNAIKFPNWNHVFLYLFQNHISKWKLTCYMDVSVVMIATSFTLAMTISYLNNNF